MTKHLRGMMYRVLDAVPNTLALPIISGPLRSTQWIMRSGNYSCWLGRYELAKQWALLRVLRPGSVFFDIGAHVGFYTLLAAHIVGPNGLVVAFEPSPRNLTYLRRHVSINRLTNVRILASAVSDMTGVGLLKLASNGYTNALAFVDEVQDLPVSQVATSTLDDLTHSGLPMPNCIKMDIEGAEYSALQGAIDVLRTSRPVVLLATHGTSIAAACIAQLERLDYRVETLEGKGLLSGEYVAVPM